MEFAYDVLNRVTNMVDSIGTTRYAYDATGQLLSEGGLFASDIVANTFSNRERLALSLQQPTGLWTNGFGWDLAGRMTNVTSSAGGFGYTYTSLYSSFSGRLVQKLSLPNGASVTNRYDPVARLLDTVLKSSGGITLGGAYYGYNVGSQRTAYTNGYRGPHYLYNYDPIGQVTVGTSSTASENRGYAYDAAWNLKYLTNNGALNTFVVDTKNQLTNAFGAAYAHDSNGNRTSGDDGHDAYVYDDENRLVQWFWYATDASHLTDGALRTDFFYDGIGRLRKRLEYSIVCSTGGGGASPSSQSGSMPGPLMQQPPPPPQWGFNYGVLYIYDGMRVIQERDQNNTPTVSYTRGNDLSGSLEGAGGIGGLLARSSGYSGGAWTSHAYYHADGNGNITTLIDGSQSVVASYRYDPFGNTLSQSGTLAGDNVYRFSSKEAHTNSLMYYYGYRFYDPILQRWPNRDPIAEGGGLNLYSFLGNNPEDHVDTLGLEKKKVQLCDVLDAIKTWIDTGKDVAKEIQDAIKNGGTKGLTPGQALSQLFGLGQLTDNAVAMLTAFPDQKSCMNMLIYAARRNQACCSEAAAACAQDLGIATGSGMNQLAIEDCMRKKICKE